MASTDDVKKLAALARLSIPEHDLARFSKEFESILTYISQINELKVSKEAKAVPTMRNVFREDGEPHATGLYTEKIAEQFPQRDGEYLSVKQIITHD
ncbi:MAG TPA: Asp-tRNA(Asn)/Glu-tRNA(Gln) amidotransferase subunit GatC [Candidatus Paceibacterota bacterium]|nr:Asp-tRNA(Asn)/Glu-tRNA(Gln) amidotransferase subunit GatC [Candidatus Paceibacterota bacterium]